MRNIKLIVGLQNPGANYSNTRHNAGKWVLDALLQRYHGQLKTESRYFGEVAEISINGHRVRLLAPTTFMNLSGKAVQALANYFNISVEEIAVIHDELGIEPGDVRIKQGGGDNGHNGLKDITRNLGNNYWRVRIGIGHPGDKSLVANYVLNAPAPAEKEALAQAVDAAVKRIEEAFK